MLQVNNLKCGCLYFKLTTMQLRVARHTSNLNLITNFYTRLLGLQVLGDFTGHAGYDGVFLGLPDTGWHLEFTTSDELPDHQPDEDDLLVFYADNKTGYQKLIDKFAQENITEVKAKNPYWELNGHTYADPDGYRVVITLKS
jgi:catechol 2,3-dioxygenase-like lactoylglutathione lyase family enzyme